jgi:sugar lactone lactonase YvrE
MTLDTKKNLWVCHYGGSCITVYNPKGRKIHKINLPAKNITNCTFGGTNNSELFITSAIKGLKKSDIKKYNLSGSLFKVKTNCKGVISKQFSMSV